jgi:23S rRNA (cytosine1962-C5)-methyltransferase
MQHTQARLRLKRGKERPLLQGHHWIYSGAIEALEGDLGALVAEVFSHGGEKLGTALLNPGRSIGAHLVARNNESIEEAFSLRIEAAVRLRKALFDSEETNAFRLIHAEGDGLPGLIVDSYNGVLVIQISHPALDGFKSLIVDLLVAFAAPRAVYEKSTSFLRKKEGLEEVKGHLYGEVAPCVEVKERGLSFAVDLLEGQKTGLFLDQREMRSLVRGMAAGKRVLNCFAYTGGFSVAALAGGALQVDSVEISKKCAASCDRNLELNGCEVVKHRFLAEDAIRFIGGAAELPYDLVILDPPAFVKKRQDIANAFWAYKDLNGSALKKMPSNSFLLTSSCSYHVGEELFQNILFRAGLEAGRRVKILERHRQAADHPISLYHPETTYLKSLLLWVE